MLLWNMHGPHCTGKTENYQKKSLSRKAKDGWKFCKNTAVCRNFFFLTNIVNSLIVTIQDIAIFAANCSIYFYETVCQIGGGEFFSNETNGYFQVGQGKQ